MDPGSAPLSNVLHTVEDKWDTDMDALGLEDHRQASAEEMFGTE